MIGGILYLQELLILNSGAIADVTLRTDFNSDGTPKPIVLVGANGSGKTSVLSAVADALIEIASLKFKDVTPAEGMGRKFYRVLGGRTIRLSSSFELIAARFQHDASEFLYRSKAGNLPPSEVATRMAAFGPVSSWHWENNDKIASGPVEKINEIFSVGAYVFFPANRHELPYWLNSKVLEHDPLVDFLPTYTDHLPKPIVVQSSFKDLKAWLLGLLADQPVSIQDIMLAPDIESLRAQTIMRSGSAVTALAGVGKILSTILSKPARITRILRGQGERRICIASQGNVLVPTLESLSAGQGSLLSIFGTIVQHADFGSQVVLLHQVEGVVLIDEADAHLHADLQHEVLPQLMRLFPRVQFIVTSHTPLFPLGMKTAFGEHGFQLVEMPNGNTIDVERYVDFERSFRTSERRRPLNRLSWNV